MGDRRQPECLLLAQLVIITVRDHYSWQITLALHSEDLGAHVGGDRAGVIVATLCFVHCTAGPARLTFAGFSSFLLCPRLLA